MTTIVMLGGLTLFLINRRWSRAALICLVPVSILLAYYGRGDRLNLYAVCVGMIMIAASPVFERIAGRFLSGIGKKAVPDTEEDILDNKTKWRMIIAGYVIFILFAIFSVISIIRLNTKINTLYGFTQDLDQRIEDVSDTRK